MKEKSLTFASIVAAGVASVCCIGPMLAVGLGLGTFGWSALSEELRPWLLGGSVLLLAGAFYLTYYRQPDAECADGMCALSPEKRRKRKMLLWLSTTAVALFSIDGMTCDGCAAGVRATLERQQDVQLAEVDYENATARVYFDHSQTSATKLIDAIGQLGFRAELKEPQS